jgi:hypothetical protein
LRLLHLPDDGVPHQYDMGVAMRNNTAATIGGLSLDHALIDKCRSNALSAGCEACCEREPERMVRAYRQLTGAAFTTWQGGGR